MTTWIRLKHGNDWGQDYYAIEPLGPWGTADSQRGVRPAPGSVVQVRLRDGRETSVTCRVIRYEVMTGDHGHEYHSVAERLMFGLDVGAEAEALLSPDCVDVTSDWVAANTPPPKKGPR